MFRFEELKKQACQRFDLSELYGLTKLTTQYLLCDKTMEAHIIEDEGVAIRGIADNILHFGSIDKSVEKDLSQLLTEVKPVQINPFPDPPEEIWEKGEIEQSPIDIEAEQIRDLVEEVWSSGQIFSVEGSITHSWVQRRIWNSKGLDLQETAFYLSYSLEITIQQSLKTHMLHIKLTQREPDVLRASKTISEKIARVKNALREPEIEKEEIKKFDSAILETQALSDLLNAVAPIFRQENIDNGLSPFAHPFESQVLIYDDGGHPELSNFRHFDDEGVPSKRTPTLRKEVACGVNTAESSHDPTSNACRFLSVAHYPESNISNLILEFEKMGRMGNVLIIPALQVLHLDLASGNIKMLIPLAEGSQGGVIFNILFRTNLIDLLAHACGVGERGNWNNVSSPSMKVPITLLKGCDWP